MTRTRETHREMILSPYQWPLFYLPLKRGEGINCEIALLKAAMTKKQHDGLIERFGTAALLVQVNMSIFGPLGEITEVVYKDVDALLDDGWVVD